MIHARPTPSRALTAVVVILSLIAAAMILENTRAPSAPEMRSASEQIQETEFFSDTHRDPVLGLREGNQASYPPEWIHVVGMQLQPPDPSGGPADVDQGSNTEGGRTPPVSVGVGHSAPDSS